MSVDLGIMECYVITVTLVGILVWAIYFRAKLGWNNWIPNCTYKIKEEMDGSGRVNYKIFRCKYGLKGYYKGQFDTLSEAIGVLKSCKSTDERKLKELKRMNDHKSKWVSDDEMMIEEL